MGPLEKALEKVMLTVVIMILAMPETTLTVVIVQLSTRQLCDTPFITISSRESW